jgi:predicted nucleic acid-binding protein
VSVFIDSSAFYAVMDADDDRHAAARDEWERLLKGRDMLHTTNYVLVETAALLQSRLGMDALRTFTADILPVLSIRWVDEGLHRSAQHALLVSGRRNLSLVDCTSFEALRSLGLDRVFCFDPHFAEQGFRIVPAPGASAGGLRA